MTKEQKVNVFKALVGVLLLSSTHHALSQASPEEVSGANTDEDTQLEEILVIGVRGSQAKSIDIKRNASEIVDSIVAEDIGKLPDTTITDSLQRIAGVQITREANEGTSLNIRGMPQVLTTLNGEQFLSPWTITNVGANYGDIPAGMISGADVFKSTSANKVAGGISGIVDLKTFSPLAFDNGFTSKFRGELAQGSRSKKEIQADGSTDSRNPDHNLSAILAYNMDGDYGVTVGLFTSESNAANYTLRGEQRLAFLDQIGGSPGDPNDINGDGDLTDWYMVPQEYGVSSNFMERSREGASVSFEGVLNDEFTVQADIFYTGMEQFDRGVKAAFEGRQSVTAYEVNGAPSQTPEEVYDVLREGTITSTVDSITYPYEGSTRTRDINTVQVAKIEVPAFQSISSNHINRTAAINTNWQVDYTNNENFEATARFVYAKAEKQFRKAQLTQGAPGWLWVDIDGINGKDPIDPIDVTVDYRGDYPSFSFDKDLSDANLLEMYQGFGDGENTSATLSVVRLDGEYLLEDINFFDSVEFGIRRGSRDAEHSFFYYVMPTDRYSTWNDPRVPEDDRYQLRTGNAIWEKYPEWRRFDYLAEDANLRAAGLTDNGFSRDDTIVFSDFGPINGFENGISSVSPSAWDDPLAFLNRLYPGTKTAEEPGRSYRVKEATTSVYGQLDFAHHIGDVPFSGNFGVRVVRTDRDVTRGVVPEVLDRFNSIGYEDWQKIAFISSKEHQELSFTDILPSFNINFYPTEDTVLRFGAAQTTSRNDLKNVGENLNLWYQRCPKTDQNGDPVQVLDTNGNLVQETVSCVGGGSDQGNPTVKPWMANVFNSSAEWYFAENSILGMGLFLIQIKDSVESYQEQRNFTDGDGFNRGNMANIYVTSNAEASDLWGLELGYKQPFSFLPGDYLSATGIEFNYTYSQSEAAETDLNGEHFPLASNSEHQANFILWYDKSGLNVRLAYNWRSDEYISRVALNTNETVVSLGNWQEPAGYIDLNINYWVNDNLSFFANGTNLTEQDRKRYAQYESQLNELWVQERRIAIGVNLSF